MTWLQSIFIIVTVFFLSVGQILFKMASYGIDLSISGFVGSLFNGKLVAALCVYFVATIMWLIALKMTPLRIAYPFAALAFIIVPVLANHFLDEQLSWNTFVGAVIISIGVFVSVYK